MKQLIIPLIFLLTIVLVQTSYALDIGQKSNLPYVSIPSNEECPYGQFIYGFNDDGTFKCSYGNVTVNLTSIDEKVKVNISDTTTDYLWNKLYAGTGITLSVLNSGGNEQIRIDSSGGNGTGGGGSWFANTVATSNGNIGGYPVADGMCDSEYSGTHLCTFDEIKRTIENGDVGTFPDGDNAWFANGPPGYTANANDCYGWTSSTATYLGPFWLFDDTTGGEGWLTNCGQIKSLACCK